MGNWQGVRKIGLFTALAVAIGTFGGAAVAAELQFHGYFESNLRFRDTDGFQSSFLDNMEVVQQRNTLKFDLDVLPKDVSYNYDGGAISLEKFHFTYRGAYDSVFDWRDDEYEDIPHSVDGTFNYGLNDIRFENDLREASFDTVYEGGLGNSYLRLGRQMVSWGEAGSEVLLDKLNPFDMSHEKFFINPDELKTPVWMARYNHSFPEFANMAPSIDLVYIPDVRPYQLAPTDASESAPYAPLAALTGLNVDNDVEDDEPAVGVKLGATLFQYLDVSLVYYEGINAQGNLTMHMMGLAPTSVSFEHPRTETYGGYFSVYVPPVDSVVRGEFARTNRETVSVGTPGLSEIVGNPFTGPYDLRLWRQKAVDRAMLCIDKNIWMRWLSPTQVQMSLEYIHTHVEGFDDPAFDNSPNYTQDSGLFTYTAMWWWLHGNINPLIAILYHTEDVWSTRVDVRYNVNKSWYTKVQTQAFWGDTTARTAYAGEIGSTEVSFLVGYQW